MPTTTPTGNFAATLYNLETLICSSATFRTAVGASTVDGARARVYWLADLPGDDAARPFAWIQLGQGWEAKTDASGPAGFWHTMQLRVMFEREDDQADTKKERQIKFWNFVGAVIGEMEAVAKGSGQLWVTAFTLADHSISAEQEKDLYQQAVFDVKVF